MVNPLAKPDPADPALARFGLAADELSDRALTALAKLAAERDALAQLLAQAEEKADRDALTDCLNRRAFMRELHRTISAVERYGNPSAVLYIDLDGFKAVNDGFGHAAGDAVLRHIARLLGQSVRESDMVGRLGGDEFGIILGRATPEEAFAKADMLEQAIKSSPTVFAGKAHRVSASIGVHPIATFEDPEIALARADEAMYADKHRRRLAGQFPEF